MGSQTIDYQAVIRDLEKRRLEFNQKFDSAVEAIRQVAAMQAGATASVSSSLPFSPQSGLQPYRGMSMIDAAIAHITKVGHGVPNVELARAVEAGGFVHRSKNFPNTLNSILWRRAKTIGDLRKTKRGWELSERDRGVSLRAADAQ